MTGDLNTTFGHRPIYICGEAATFIPNSSFLIPHSGRAFIHNQWTEPPKGLTLNPEPLFFYLHFPAFYATVSPYPKRL